MVFPHLVVAEKRLNRSRIRSRITFKARSGNFNQTSLFLLVSLKVFILLGNYNVKEGKKETSCIVLSVFISLHFEVLKIAWFIYLYCSIHVDIQGYHEIYWIISTTLWTKYIYLFYHKNVIYVYQFLLSIKLKLIN